MTDGSGRPMPTARDFDRSVEAYARMVEREAPRVAEECRSRLLHHGRPTSRAFLLLHGFTNCPAQYARVAESLHARGATVLAPLAEGHGRIDGSAHALGDLTAEGLARWTAEMIEIAARLGERLSVVGFSFGGVCAAWSACNCSDVDDVVLLSPAFLPYGYPLQAARLLPLLSHILPERQLWWDPVRRERMIRSPYAYQKLSSRGIGAVFELGQLAWHSPALRRGELRRAVLVLNEADLAISRPAARRSFEEAVAPLAAHAEIRRISATLKYPHDFIDPLGPIRDGEPDARARVLEAIGLDDGRAASDAEM